MIFTPWSFQVCAQFSTAISCMYPYRGSLLIFWCICVRWMGLGLGELSPSILCPTFLACIQHTNIMSLVHWGRICRINMTTLDFLIPISNLVVRIYNRENAMYLAEIGRRLRGATGSSCVCTRLVTFLMYAQTGDMSTERKLCGC